MTEPTDSKMQQTIMTMPTSSTPTTIKSSTMKATLDLTILGETSQKLPANKRIGQPPLNKEVIAAIKKMHNNKATGPTGLTDVTTSMLKKLSDEGFNFLYQASFVTTGATPMLTSNPGT